MTYFEPETLKEVLKNSFGEEVFPISQDSGVARGGQEGARAPGATLRGGGVK